MLATASTAAPVACPDPLADTVVLIGRRCPACRGTGRVPDCHGHPVDGVVIFCDCDRCRGNGWLPAAPAPPAAERVADGLAAAFGIAARHVRPEVGLYRGNGLALRRVGAELVVCRDGAAPEEWVIVATVDPAGAAALEVLDGPLCPLGAAVAGWLTGRPAAEASPPLAA